ncbi:MULTISPECIES: glycosyltransferase [Sphingobium]|uniref:glycosyltransferase n=1 Tax=Sphingobium TaxID=165695 RepID=UPI000770065E|nr:MULTISPECIES: glycosyltransferase [Sphingobium]AMK26085.1 group 1 glycosyl transferase [Sphingobium sp. TKS]
MASIVHWGKYYPPDMGGIESVTESLARGATADGHTVTVACFGKGEARQEIDLHGVRVLRAPIAFSQASQPIGWRYFRWLLKEGRKADIVHLHAPNMLAALASALLGTGTKLIVHWHSDVVGKGILGRFLRPVEKLMLRRADKIICTSPPYADASAVLQPFRHKIAVVPLGVPDKSGLVSLFAGSSRSAIPPDLRSRLEGRRVILSVGRLVPYKGFDTLIRAASMLPDEAIVVVVGSGPLRADLEGRIMATGGQSRVILAGRLEDEALHELFSLAELYCMPSVERSEAFGVVLIEAMSHGLPVVATNIAGSGVPWVNKHGESGLNVPPNDPKALAAACTRILLDDQLCNELACGARRRFKMEFCESLSVSRMNALYESLHPASPTGPVAHSAAVRPRTGMHMR